MSEGKEFHLSEISNTNLRIVFGVTINFAAVVFLILVLSPFLRIPQMLSVQSDPLPHASYPSVHAFIMLEGTMNLTGETQPLVEQLMMIKRMQVMLFLSKIFFITATPGHF